MSDEKFRWGKNGLLWYANSMKIAGWIGYDSPSQFWYARTAGTIDNPTVRAEFDNEESARDFLMFLANSETQ